MVNYQNGKIYKIESLCGDKIYIGSTSKHYLCQRLVQHYHDYKQWKQNKPNVSRMTSYELFDEYGYENCFITLLESYPCNSRDELKAKEAFYIKSMKCVNKTMPGRTKTQYNIDNREVNRVKALEFYHKHKERITEKQKVKHNCDCGGKYTTKGKAPHIRSKLHQQYLEQLGLPSSLTEKDLMMIDKTKEILRNRASLQICCECGVICKKVNKRLHIKSKFHQEFINKKTKEEIII